MNGPKALLKLRVVPNAKRSEIVGEYGEAIKLKIAAPAVEGKANEALLGYVADQLGFPAERWNWSPVKSPGIK